MPGCVRNNLVENFEIDEDIVMRTRERMDWDDWHQLTKLHLPHLKDAPFSPCSIRSAYTEIFDDLYLGLQAGGALRKQRRGEELTEQEEAALGHWQRLSVWRKVVAVGAFALGTFGLGFTLGGLIFGRRRARA